MLGKRSRFYAIFLLVACWLGSTTQLNAHAKDQSYLYLRIYQDHIEGTVEATYKDLNIALGLDLERGMQLDDIKNYLPMIQEYFRNGISIKSDQGEHRIQFIEPRLMEAKMGVFLKSDFVLDNVANIPESMEVSYDLVFDKDPNHRAFLVIRHHWLSGIIDNEGHPYAGFTPTIKTVSLDLSATSKGKGIWKLFRMGVRHLLTGLDHLFFLVAFLLPLVLIYKESSRQWRPIEYQQQAGKAALRLVLPFLAMVILGLTLVGLGVVKLPSNVIEAMIALSIGAAALNNIRPWPRTGMLLLMILAGLFHGFGFASMLDAKGLRGEYLSESLLGFNLGVVAAIVAVGSALLLLFTKLRAKPKYIHWMRNISIAFMVISIYWFIERMFGVDFIIDNYIGKAFGKVFGIFHHH